MVFQSLFQGVKQFEKQPEIDTLQGRRTVWKYGRGTSTNPAVGRSRDLREGWVLSQFSVVHIPVKNWWGWGEGIYPRFRRPCLVCHFCKQRSIKGNHWCQALFSGFSRLKLITGYSFWDRLRNFFHKFTWIVLSVHKLNNWVNSVKSMNNCWTSCRVVVDMEKFTTISQ